MVGFRTGLRRCLSQPLRRSPARSRVPAEAWRGYDWRSRAAAYHRAQIRDALGFREPTLDDTDALVRWLEGQVSALEHRQIDCW